MNCVLKPSIPGADEMFAPAMEAFNSSMVRGSSRVARSASLSLEL